MLRLNLFKCLWKRMWEDQDAGSGALVNGDTPHKEHAVDSDKFLAQLCKRLHCAKEGRALSEKHTASSCYPSPPPHSISFSLVSFLHCQFYTISVMGAGAFTVSVTIKSIMLMAFVWIQPVFLLLKKGGLLLRSPIQMHPCSQQKHPSASKGKTRVLWGINYQDQNLHIQGRDTDQCSSKHGCYMPSFPVWGHNVQRGGVLFPGGPFLVVGNHRLKMGDPPPAAETWEPYVQRPCGMWAVIRSRTECGWDWVNKKSCLDSTNYINNLL